MVNKAHETARDDEQLSQGVLGTSSIVFMVMAVSAPLAVVVALMPMAFAFGNGAGVPGTWVLAIGAMLLFAIGYVRIIPFVVNAGAFYAYISASLGKECGLAAAYIAAVSYFALSCSTLAALAFFCADFFHEVAGLQTPWELWTVMAVGLLVFLAYHRITLAATVLSIALVAEVALIALLAIAVAFDRGFAAFQITDFSPSTVFAPGLGVALIYAFNSLIGFESTAIYQEEARDRHRTIPRATYVSVIAVGFFYVIAAWALTSSVGSASVSAMAAADPGHFVADRAAEHLGPTGRAAFSTLILTSAFAAVLGLFNNATRYLFALARDGVLPRRLARTHRVHGSPHVAGMVLAAVLIVSMAAASVAGLDPLLNISTSLVGLGSVGLMALLGVTALAVPVFFARRGQFGWRTGIAPLLGGIAILAATGLAVANYSLLTGVDLPVVNRLPILLVIVAGAGLVQARWLLRNRPHIYQRIGVSRVDDQAVDGGVPERL